MNAVQIICLIISVGMLGGSVYYLVKSLKKRKSKKAVALKDKEQGKEEKK